MRWSRAAEWDGAVRAELRRRFGVGGAGCCRPSLRGDGLLAHAHRGVRGRMLPLLLPSLEAALSV